MEHQADSKMRNLTTDMKCCPHYIVKWKTEIISLCPSKCLYMKNYIWKKSLATFGQQNDRRGKRPGHLIQSLLLELRKTATCTVIALYLLTMLLFFNSISLSEIILIVNYFQYPARMSAQKVQHYHLHCIQGACYMAGASLVRRELTSLVFTINSYHFQIKFFFFKFMKEFLEAVWLQISRKYEGNLDLQFLMHCM